MSLGVWSPWTLPSDLLAWNPPLLALTRISFSSLWSLHKKQPWTQATGFLLSALILCQHLLLSTPFYLQFSRDRRDGIEFQTQVPTYRCQHVGVQLSLESRRIWPISQPSLENSSSLLSAGLSVHVNTYLDEPSHKSWGCWHWERPWVLW